MAKINEFSGILNAAGTVCTITVPAGQLVPVGSIIEIGVCTSATAMAALTITDSRGNAYTTVRSIFTTAGGNTYQCHAVVPAGKALASGDVITITAAASQTRFAAVAGIFDDLVSGLDPGPGGTDGGAANNNASATSAAPTSGTFTTVNATALLIGVIGMVSSGRIYTPNANWTAGAKIVTTSTGNRGVVMQHRYVTVTGAYQANGTFDSGALYGATAQAYVMSGPPPARSGRPWVWVEALGVWAPKPALIDSVGDGSWVERPVSGWDGSQYVLSK
jgi:hypothetical protein